MNTKERLKSYCKSVGLTVKEFEVSIGASNGYVNSISKGIGEDKLSIIIEKFPNLSIEWLLTGKGKMLKEESNSEGLEANQESTVLDELRKEYNKLLERMEEVNNYQKSVIEAQQSLIDRLMKIEKCDQNATLKSEF